MPAFTNIGRAVMQNIGNAPHLWIRIFWSFNRHVCELEEEFEDWLFIHWFEKYWVNGSSWGTFCWTNCWSRLKAFIFRFWFKNPMAMNWRTVSWIPKLSMLNRTYSQWLWSMGCWGRDTRFTSRWFEANEGNFAWSGNNIHDALPEGTRCWIHWSSHFRNRSQRLST